MSARTTRQDFQKPVKKAAAVRSRGVCERHRWKHLEPCTRPACHFDHILPTALGGPPTLENAAHLCLVCHKEKTREEDAPRIAKANAQRDAHEGIKRQSRPIAQRPKPAKRPSRPSLPPRALYR